MVYRRNQIARWRWEKAYLSAFVDLYDRSIISWELGHSDNNLLVGNTIKKQRIRTLVYDHSLIVIADFNTCLMTIRNLKKIYVQQKYFSNAVLSG